MARRSLLLAAFSFVASIGAFTSPASARTAPPALPTWGHAATVDRDGHPVFEVDGKPFFVYGAAFFYERLPRGTWQSSLVQLKYDLGINTLDLYVPWNWHEPSDGNFDFTGRTNERRDLRTLLKLARELDFKIILRPGPVIRNEWRNGGYPDWLLRRPAYGMPLRDILEGRYPATATLQNKHSDDAAAQWMRNATHMTYAAAWLKRALHEFDPVADRVIAVALDDDQGAYLDNQTWPAPHLVAYLDWLRTTVHSVTGPREPVFINTYNMKVTASSPVWAMGNWYQSDAYSIGEHDRAQLGFSTGLLHTRPGQPMMVSEFQAGWLEGPQDVLPQPADPTNTSLALNTMIGAGVRGVVNFPAQDTMYPAGWEVPFANSFYAWDAALGYDDALAYELPLMPTQFDRVRGPSSRFDATASVGQTVSLFGPMLARARTIPDAAIAYLTSAFDERTTTSDDIAAIADRTIEAQRACRLAGLTCPLVDLRYVSLGDLRRYAFVIVPLPARDKLDAAHFIPSVADKIRTLARDGKVAPETTAITSDVVLSELERRHLQPAVRGVPGASVARDPQTAAAFLFVANYDAAPVDYRATLRAPGLIAQTLELTLGARGAAILPIDVPLSFGGANQPATAVRFTSSCQIASLTKRLFRVHAERTCRFTTIANKVRHNFTTEQGETGPFTVSPSGAITYDQARLITHTLAPRPTPVRYLGTLPVRNDLLVDEPTPATTAIAGGAIAYRKDIYRDGFPCVVLENDVVRLILSPSSGGRAFIFEDTARLRNAFDTVGALRDDVVAQPPASPTDRIARYTHQFPAGFSNRPYMSSIEQSGSVAVVRLKYSAPDAYPHGAAFERTITLRPHERRFRVDESAHFAGNDASALAQRARTISSFTAGDVRDNAGILVVPAGSALAGSLATTDANAGAWGRAATGSATVAGLFDPKHSEVALEAWSDAGDAVTQPRAHSLDTYVSLRRDAPVHLLFAFEPAATLDDARARAADLVCALTGAPCAPPQVVPSSTRTP